MRVRIGSNSFSDVTVPVLWGARAVLMDRKGRLSVIDLSGVIARLEIVGDDVAPGVAYSIKVDGLAILSLDGEELYVFSAQNKSLATTTLGLPEIRITANEVRVGSNIFSSSMVSGFGVGISVQGNSISMGGPLPPGLAPLVAP